MRRHAAPADLTSVSGVSSYDVIAQRIFDTATGAGVDADRKFIAPGPDFAHDCRLIAVYLEAPDAVPLQREFAGSCASVPQIVFRVVFAADCVPAVDDNGNPPPADDVTAWSTAFLADVSLIHHALVIAGGDDQLGCDCSNVSIGRGQVRGPSGGMASVSIPVTITDLD